MKQCPTCKMTVDEKNECPICGTTLTYEPIVDAEKEHIILNKYYNLIDRYIYDNQIFNKIN